MAQLVSAADDEHAVVHVQVYIMIQQTGLMTTTLSDHNQPKPLRFYAGHDL